MRRNWILPLAALLAGVLFFLTADIAGAETITLQDGRVIQGQLTRQGDDFLIQPDQGSAFTVPVSDVVSISLSGPTNPQQDAIDQWQYLQSQIPQQNDLGQIVTMLQGYIKQYPQSPNLSDAQKILSEYVLDEAQGYVKFGGKWMSSTDAEAMQKQLDAMIVDAVKQFRSGELIQSQTEAQKVLAADHGYADALIIIGVVQFRQNNLQNALIQFNTVLQKDPNNVIALNDAAIVYYQLNVNTQPRALGQYQTALNQAAGNRLLLDNIAAALQSYQGDTQTILYTNLSKSFAIADQQMQIIMAKQGLYRSGAVWVSSAQKKQLDAQQEVFNTQKQALQASYDAALNSLQGINNQLSNLSTQISQLQQQIQQLSQPTYVGGATGGAWVTTANNQALVSQDTQQLAILQQQQQQLQTQKVQCQTQIQSIQVAAQRLMQSEASGGLSGEQIMMLPGDLTNVPPPLPASLLANTQSPAAN
ncbi:MAG TPA: hypothetical protein VMG59_13040 [Phycisphaerae bacterium]|nr:hypothetical protein [Phycisphaerae bacterium]